MSTASDKLKTAWTDVKLANGWLLAQVPLVQTHWGAFLFVLGVGFLLGAVLI